MIAAIARERVAPGRRRPQDEDGRQERLDAHRVPPATHQHPDEDRRERPEGGQTRYSPGRPGRWLPSGEIEFLGREDHQVKIRGFRIELGEIEAVLLTHPAIGEAAVIDRDDPLGSYLAAYLVTRRGL